MHSNAKIEFQTINLNNIMKITVASAVDRVSRRLSTADIVRVTVTVALAIEQSEHSRQGFSALVNGRYSKSNSNSHIGNRTN